MPIEQVETLIIGGGQAGLAMSYRLKQRGLAHLVLERQRIGERWRSERWDGLRFQFPNWSVRLPDFSFPHTDPDGFAANREIVEFIDAYAAFVAPPIRCGVDVKRLRRRNGGEGFVTETSAGSIEAKNVVVATGPYQRAVIPDVFPITPSCFSCTPAATKIRRNCRPVRCWWSAPAPPARRLPKSCCAPAAASFLRSAATPGCRAATAAAT
jgi:cation diffusion facilitator CzcD-associated flavoprotein CzcO